MLCDQYYVDMLKIENIIEKFSDRERFRSYSANENAITNSVRVL